MREGGGSLEEKLNQKKKITSDVDMRLLLSRVALLSYVVVMALEQPLLLSRRSVSSLAVLLPWLIEQPAVAAAEWTCDLGDFKVTKRQESSLRIRPETMLTATSDYGRELKLLKVPLGVAAASSFGPDDQIEMSRYFSSKQEAERIGTKRIADIFRQSLLRQVKSPSSPLLDVSLDTNDAKVVTKKGRRYVTLKYATDGCRKLDEDGLCVGRAKRIADVIFTVSLESQARTLEEQRRMDSGDLEVRITIICLTQSRRATSIRSGYLQRRRPRAPPAPRKKIATASPTTTASDCESSCPLTLRILNNILQTTGRHLLFRSSKSIILMCVCVLEN